jgi:mannose-6-phosphate isomerase-like protein (cupin superfamily)
MADLLLNPSLTRYRVLIRNKTSKDSGMVYTHEELLTRDGKGRPAGRLLGDEHGAECGFCVGISYYDADQYVAPGVHEDQEGFYVLEGTGTADVGGAEFSIRPGSSFLAAKGVPHRIRRDPASGPIKVLWTHGAVNGRTCARQPGLTR